ncbi:crossover junction endonuclease MUS81-like isoform X2 [Phragmites australis]|uniref:crossover junction endonuclease MUS81-like isoform X2 n=1 Tax=Phragmites australis TaxID=29695 RepID=UPI002D768D0A|nr:crossover junction endonuclease MUS81-like isoform X2 [Phragmites australis]
MRYHQPTPPTQTAEHPSNQLNGGLFLFPTPKPQTLAQPWSQIPIRPPLSTPSPKPSLMAPPSPKQPKPLPVPKQLKVNNPENDELARFFLEKWRSMMQEPGGLSENNYLTFANANRSLCAAKEPIRTLKDFSKIKGVGQWLTRCMKGFFAESSQELSPARDDTAGGNGKKTRGPKCYLPKKNTAAYAILITLLRAKISGKSFMLKQELIDAAEASGLSRDAVGPNKSKAKQSYGKDWYSGWSCMKTLLSKKLVNKWSNPAKYMLTEEGEGTAHDCLSRSGLGDSVGPLIITSAHNISVASHNSDHCTSPGVAETMSGPFMATCRSSTSKLVCGSSTKEQSSYNGQVQTTNYCAEGIIFCDSDSEEPYKKNSPLKVKGPTINCAPPDYSVSISHLSSQGIFEQQSSSTMGSAEFNVLDKDTAYMDNSILAMPPRQSNEKFREAYEVVFILDDREKFGSRSRKVADNIRSQINVPVEVKHLPVGDAIWIARHRKLRTEYVLDFIVERKEVSDLDGSITDNRYRDQKLRLKRCGLRKLIYLVEGDPNRSDAPERIKIACFTTEILEGFDVHRTSGYAETERTYGHLTHSIIEYYDTNFSTLANTARVCPTYDEFEARCHDLQKTTVSQIFALQLMQVPQVTEEAALAVIELYPTLISLVRAYSMLDGDTRAQEEMLKNKSKMVNAGASRNIFKLVWADG